MAKDEWILFARRTHPVVRDAFMDAAQRQGIAPKHLHDILTPQEAIYLVSQHVGVVIVTEPASVGLSAEGVVYKAAVGCIVVFRNMLDYENRRCFAISERVRPLLPSQTCTTAHATKANGILAVTA